MFFYEIQKEIVKVPIVKIKILAVYMTVSNFYPKRLIFTKLFLSINNGFTLTICFLLIYSSHNY